MRRFLLPALAGVMCAACWTVWTGAVADKNPLLTVASEFGLLVVSWFTWGWYVDKKYASWWVYAVTSAITSGFVVWLQGR